MKKLYKCKKDKMIDGVRETKRERKNPLQPLRWENKYKDKF